MKRLDDWPIRLAEVIELWRSSSFAWGSKDCCQFVGAVVQRITGEDRRTLFDSYDSEMSAARLLVQHGGMEGLLTAAFGGPKIAALAQRGDVVLCEFGRGPQPAICLGAWCVAPAEYGLEKRMTRVAQLAWSI